MTEHFNKWLEQLTPWFLVHGIRILFIVTGAIIINFLANKFISKTVRIAITSRGFNSKESEMKRENTLIRIFSWTVTILIIVVAALMVLEETGVSIGPILASIGVLGLAVGFGGQYLIRDVISGFFIILENQYRIGDVVSFDGTGGLVEDISLRMTTLRDMDGTVHHIPHGEIKKVANLSKDFSRINLNVGISYSANLDEVITVIDQVGKKMSEEPEWKDLFITAPHVLRVDDFADSSVVLKIVADTKPLQQWTLTGELRKRLKITFDNKGIEIPFPQRVVHHSAL